MRRLALIALLFASGCGFFDGLFELSGDPCDNNLGSDCEDPTGCLGCAQLCGSGSTCEVPDLAFNGCGLANEVENRISSDFNLFLDPQSIRLDGGTATLAVNVLDQAFELDPETIFVRVNDSLADAPTDLRGPAVDGGEGFELLDSSPDEDLGAVVHELEISLRFPEGVPAALNMVVQARTDSGQSTNSVCVVSNGDLGF